MSSATKAAGGWRNRRAARWFRKLGGKAEGRQGQSTVEAAFALPVLLTMTLLLLQPGIVLYDRIVMQGAASEACRLLATTDDAGLAEDFVRRRLGAVPQLDQFHVHSSGCTWLIELSGDETANVTSAHLATEVRPLPLMDGVLVLLGMTNDKGNLVVEVESTQQVQPDWVDGAVEGRAPSDWVGI